MLVGAKHNISVNFKKNFQELECQQYCEITTSTPRLIVRNGITTDHVQNEICRFIGIFKFFVSLIAWYLHIFIILRYIYIYIPQVGAYNLIDNAPSKIIQLRSQYIYII